MLLGYFGVLDGLGILVDLIIWVFLGSFDLGFWGFWRIWRIWGFCGFGDFEDLVILRIWGFCGFGDLWIR